MEILMEKFFDKSLESSLAEERELKLSEEECQKRIKHHEEKTQRLLEAAQRIRTKVPSTNVMH